MRVYQPHFFLVQVTKLLYVALCLKRGHVYRFSALRDVVMNKGQSRMLAFTATTWVEELQTAMADQIDLTAGVGSLESQSQSFSQALTPSPVGVLENSALISYEVSTCCVWRCSSLSTTSLILFLLFPSGHH